MDSPNLRVLRRRSIQALGLLTVLLASACAPALTPPPTPQPAAPTNTPLPPPTLILETAAQPQVPAEAPTQPPLPAATSRGPNLEATDPTTVSLASGGLQVVEFFRFT